MQRLANMNAESPVIQPRDQRFGRGSSQPRWWLNNDPVASAFYNALSVTFPRGEAFFVESVRAFRAGTSERLNGEINAFIKQEVHHSREHVAFNNRAVNSGYDITPLEADVIRLLDRIKGRPPIFDLAATMALEHFTAMLAHQLLAHPEHLTGGDSETAALWRWHALEEIEHKGVAFDTWLHATRNWPGHRRWRLRCAMMLIATRHFIRDRARGVMILLAQDGITGWSAALRVVYYSLVKPGLLRRVIPGWLSYFRPGFHPWQHDDRALI
jgi:predicted metal-dependent hydrolase